MAAAARRRQEDAVERARTVLGQLENDGQPLTYAAVASAAQVSRARLYTEPEARATIERLRAINGRGITVAVPRKRTSEASLLRRLQAAHTRNRQLSRELSEAREQLAVAHADLRDLRRTAQSPRWRRDLPSDRTG